MTTLAVVAAVGWILAAFFAALYLGERGRRKDLAWLAGYERQRHEQASARVVPDAEAEAIELMTQEQKQRLMDDLIAEANCSPETAKQEAERIIAGYQRIGSDGW